MTSYSFSEAKKVYKINNLTDEEATLIEPAACAVHGCDQLNAPVGIDALIIGAGPTGLILAQLLKLNGAHKVTIAANKGIKTEAAKQLGAGDEYIELDRSNPDAQWEQLKKDNPYGFDVVVSVSDHEIKNKIEPPIYYVGRSNWIREDRFGGNQLRPSRWNPYDLRGV